MPLVLEESEGKVVGNQTPRAECTGMVAVGMEDVKVVAQLRLAAAEEVDGGHHELVYLVGPAER